MGQATGAPGCTPAGCHGWRAGSTQAQPLCGPDESFKDASKTKDWVTEDEIADFRHRGESIKGGVKTNARVTKSRWKVLLAALGENKAGRVAVWKGKSCCDHPGATQTVRQL